MINCGYCFINVVKRFLADLDIIVEVDHMLIRGQKIEEAIERFKKFLLYTLRKNTFKKKLKKLNLQNRSK